MLKLPVWPHAVLLCGAQEFDSTTESEISVINRLAAERQDNVMWREFRTRLLRNMGLVSVGPSRASFSWCMFMLIQACNQHTKCSIVMLEWQPAAWLGMLIDRVARHAVITTM
jgi:hypothetical protein